MKAALFSAVPYMGPAPRGAWPVSTQDYSSEVAERSLESSSSSSSLMSLASTG
jgi:hypothetical protein